MSRIALVALVAALAGCPSPRAPVGPTPPPPGPGPGPGPSEPAEPSARISWQRVETAAAMPGRPAPGTYQLHLIDVGTGLAILIRGADFALLYDAGTNDRDETPMRVGAYLAAALGPSGDEPCVPPPPGARRERRVLEHVVLSHPHFDHASALDLVLHCYEVRNFWDAGRIHDTVFYSEVLARLARSLHTAYHTAADVPPDHAVAMKGRTMVVTRWDRFSEGDVVELGERARFTILHADPKQHRDPNQASVVLLVELGGARVLLVGDAVSGPRKDPSYPVGEVEEFLIDHHARSLRADILQVGHHGSKTSSRRGFLEAVRPRLALISSGPKRYGGTTLPDPEVVEALAAVGATVLRTDERDEHCPVVGRIGGDRGPGGCDSWVITIDGREEGPAPEGER